MGSISEDAPLVVVLGQTGSGKSALAMELARRFNGEIIAADSRTIYKGMDIGTAKPTKLDQKLIRHHLLDVVKPNELFSVAAFQRHAQAAIENIASRGKAPFLVGGSGLYIDAVIYNFSFREPPDESRRQTLQTMSVKELQDLLVKQGIPLPENNKNPRHLIRSLESRGEIPERHSLRPNTLVVGLLKDKEELATRIKLRVDKMIDEGFVDEVRRVSEEYGWDAPALQAPGYKTFRSYIDGQVDLNEAKRQFVQQHLQYAKRQQTWFKRNPDIRWSSNPEEIVDMVTTLLNK